MSFVPGILTNARSVVLAIAALAILAPSSLAIGEASASSGGVGTTGGAGMTSSSGGGDAQPSAERVGARFDRIWDQFGVSDKRWARRTSECESGGDPDAIGGGGIYRGAFQFMRSTWKASPKSPGGDPIAYPYRTQAVIAVLLRDRDGAGHWPVCG